MFVDFIFSNFLSAPTADEVKLQSQDTLSRRVGRRASNTIRRASVSAGKAVSKILTLSKQSTKIEQRAVMVIPEKTRIAQGLATVAVESVSKSFKDSQSRYETSREIIITSNARGHITKSNSLRPVDSTRDPNRIPHVASLNDKNESLVSELCVEVNLQRRQLRVTEQEEFDRLWGYVVVTVVLCFLISVLFSVDPTGEFATSKSLLPCLKRQDVLGQIRDEICRTQTICTEKREKFKLAADSDIGLDLIHMFILDLIGRDTPAGKIFQSKTASE